MQRPRTSGCTRLRVLLNQTLDTTEAIVRARASLLLRLAMW